MIYVLTVVDLLALTVGFSILYTVRRQIKDTGKIIEDAVKENIEQAKHDVASKFVEVALPVFGQAIQGLPGVIREAFRATPLKVSAQIETSDTQTAQLTVLPGKEEG